MLEAYRERLEAIEKRSLVGHDGLDPEEEVTVAAALRAALREIPGGTPDASRYHELMIGVFELVFFPLLLNPKKEREIHEGRKRIDIVMENGARDGIFWRLHGVRRLAAAYVSIECKNYTRDIGNPELDQLSGRFSDVQGQVGILVCRKNENRDRVVAGCRDTLRDKRGLMIPLDDKDVDALLGFIEDRRRGAIDEFIGRIVDEIYLGS